MNTNTTNTTQPNTGYTTAGAAGTQAGTVPASETHTTSAQNDLPGKSAARGLKDAVVGLHGLGDAIRGSVNAAVDDIGGDKGAAAKNRDLEERGLSEIRDGQWRGGAEAPINAQDSQLQQDRQQHRFEKSTGPGQI